MSKLLVQLALLQTKAIVNSYTWATLPLYAAIQRPWRRVKRSKSFGIISKIDPNDSSRIIYSRPSKLKLDHPNLRYNSFTEMMSHLDHKWEIFGVRDIIDEQVQRDPNTGEVIKIDGRDLKRIKLADDYRWYTVGDVLSRAEALARGLRRMGINKCPDKVTLYAENSFEWFCASIALIRMNVTTVTLLPILNDEGVLYGLNQSEASTVIVSQDLLPRLERISPQLNNKLSIIYVPNKLTDTSDTIEKLSKKFPITTFDHVMKIGNENPEMITTEELFPIPDPDDVALIMYTSGTTGNPKGVMLTHKNLVASYKNIIYINEECGSLLINTKYPAFLPMAHLYGYSLNLGHFCVKSKIGLCSPNTMLNSSPSHVPGQIGDFQLLKPEFFGGVPLMLERMLKEIYRQLESRSPLAAPLFTYLMDYKIRWTGRGFQTPIIDRLICKPINQKFGGNLQLLLVGSAPLNDRTQALIKAALNITLVQGYGATEVAPSHVMVQDDLKYGTSGGPFHSVSHYIKDWPEGGYRTTDKPNPRGEIVVGGDTVAAGYYKMPKETEESFITDSDGKRWFETGDIVEILPDLTLKIIDRKKELFKFPNGEFISPGKVESGLRSSIYVENICVCTDSFCNFTIALIAPNHRALKELADKMNKSHLNFEQQCNDAEIVDTVHKSLIELGTSLGYAKIEIPSRIRLVTEEWSQDNNLLTATMKMRRRPVNDFYRDEIKNLFAN